MTQCKTSWGSSDLGQDLTLRTVQFNIFLGSSIMHLDSHQGPTWELQWAKIILKKKKKWCHWWERRKGNNYCLFSVFSVSDCDCLHCMWPGSSNCDRSACLTGRRSKRCHSVSYWEATTGVGSRSRCLTNSEWGHHQRDAPLSGWVRTVWSSRVTSSCVTSLRYTQIKRENFGLQNTLTKYNLQNIRFINHSHCYMRCSSTHESMQIL